MERWIACSRKCIRGDVATSSRRFDARGHVQFFLCVCAQENEIGRFFVGEVWIINLSFSSFCVRTCVFMIACNSLWIMLLLKIFLPLAAVLSPLSRLLAVVFQCTVVIATSLLFSQHQASSLLHLWLPFFDPLVNRLAFLLMPLPYWLPDATSLLLNSL